MQDHLGKKLLELPNELKTKKEIQRFLGILNYVQDFIPDLAKKKLPVQMLIRKNNKIGWNEEHTNCVKKLKDEIKSLPKLRLPDEKDNLILETDASEQYFGCILGNDLGQICRYYSGTFSDTETRYCINQKECLAILKGIKKFQLFLYPKKFIVKTDNTQVRALIFGKQGVGPQDKKIHRWQVFFSKFNFAIESIKGKDNFLADLLSRPNP